MTEWLNSLLAILSLPQYGLSSVFVISFLSATLLPLGSEAAVFGLIQLQPQLWWPTIIIATIGNTLGGATNWWLGFGAQQIIHPNKPNKMLLKAEQFLLKLGPKACLFSWLPGVGDPLCLVAGWLKMPFWPCFFYMAVGKLLRYIVLTFVLTSAWQPLKLLLQ
jgi:membrane protein YqaA with SNARE-associated domain